MVGRLPSNHISTDYPYQIPKRSSRICDDKIVKKHYVILLLLVLSGFIHLWNPVEFPDIFFDEVIYVGRADNNTGNVQESAFMIIPILDKLT